MIGTYSITEDGDTTQRNYGVYSITKGTLKYEGPIEAPAAVTAGPGAQVPWAAHLRPPGLVVNTLKGDAHEQRAHRWLEWDGEAALDAALLGVPFDGASVVRTGSRHGPDAVRLAMQNYTTFASSTGATIQDVRAADVGDLDVVLTDMADDLRRLRETVAALVSGGTVLGRDRRRPLDHLADARGRHRRRCPASRSA